MKNIYDKAYKIAEAKAAKAQHGYCTINGKLYTFVFKRPDWHYEIYEDGFLLTNVKEFSLSKAKNYLKWWLAN
jgi:hypothetical protein